MMKDGYLRATISKQDTVSIYSLNYQATPWFETTFRYVGFEDFFTMIEVMKQKIRLLEESNYFLKLQLVSGM